LANGASWSCFYHEKNAVLKRNKKSQWLKGDWGKSTEDEMDEQFWRPQGQLELDDRLMSYDLNGQLKDEFLFSQDLLSMAHGMELRVPFCDHTFVELCTSVPSALRHQKSSPKAWMLEVFAEDIPHHLLNQSKRGFRIPYGSWLRGPLRTEMEQAIDRDLLSSQGCFDHAAIQKTWQAHLKGESDHEGCLWALFMFQRWWLGFAQGP
jgi:asparagine synthase (glutamine-hydrolysing)